MLDKQNNALIALIGTVNLFLKLQAVYTIVLVCQPMLNAVALLCCARLYAHWRLKQRAFVHLYCVFGLDFNLKDTQIQEDSD